MVIEDVDKSILEELSVIFFISFPQTMPLRIFKNSKYLKNKVYVLDNQLLLGSSNLIHSSLPKWLVVGVCHL